MEGKMELIEITEENADGFKDYLDPDIISELGRVFFRGLGAISSDETPVGALVYELINSENEEDTKSRIHRLKAADDTARDFLIAEYKMAVRDDEVIESFYETYDSDMVKALSAYGFSSESMESPDLHLTIEDVKRLDELRQGKKLPDYIQPLSKMTLLQYRAFVKNCFFNGHKGLVEDLAYIPMGWFDADISSCSFVDDKVDGMLLLRKMPEGNSVVMLFTAFGMDYQKNLGFLMIHSAQRIVEDCPADTKVIIRRHNDMVRRLTDRFFGNLKGDEVFYGSRQEE